MKKIRSWISNALCLQMALYVITCIKTNHLLLKLPFLATNYLGAAWPDKICDAIFLNSMELSLFAGLLSENKPKPA